MQAFSSQTLQAVIQKITEKLALVVLPKTGVKAATVEILLGPDSPGQPPKTPWDCILFKKNYFKYKDAMIKSK